MFIKILTYLIQIVRFNIRFILSKKRFISKNFMSANVRLINSRFVEVGEGNFFEIYSGIVIGNCGERIEIGNNNRLAAFSILKSHGGYISIGDSNFIGERVQVQGKGGVRIGSHCMIAPNSFISSSNHIMSDPNSIEYLKRELGSETIIEDYVWIGANTVILAGVKVGSHSIVAAGSVVTHEIAPYKMVAGIPARVIKTYDFEFNRWVAANENP